MDRMTKQNLRNIKCRFEEKTGTDLTPEHRAGNANPVWKTVAVLAAALVSCMALLGFATPLFTPLNQDELTLAASYEGNGIVSVYVENESDKRLEFQEQLKLISWTTGEEVPRLDGEVRFENTVFAAHSSGIMTVDLSEAYDITALEESLPGRPNTVYYYLLLTNNDFLFGHDWMCSFHFVQDTPADTVTVPEPELPPFPAQNIDAAEEELRFYFEDAYYDEIPAFNPVNFEYLQKVQELLLRTEGTFVRPVDPLITAETPEEAVLGFDPSREGCVGVGMNYHSIDGYSRIIGSMFSGEDSDHALVIKAFLPGEDNHGGYSMPLIFLAVYEKAALEAEKPYAFWYGQIVPFPELEENKIFEDDRYVIYEITDLIYTDLDGYLDYCAAVLNYADVNPEVRAQVHTLYDYYKQEGNLGAILVNRQAEMEALGYRDPETE